MATSEQPLRIIGNESNQVFEIEPTNDALKSKENAPRQPATDAPATTAERSNNEIATNDGAVIETLDTAFHNKPGVAAGENLSGSDRADYYEARSQGKSDAEEELDATIDDEQQ